MSRAWRWFAASLAIIVIDQWTKWLVLERFAPGEQRELTEFLNLVLVFNKGAAFSLLADAAGWQTPLLVGFAIVAALVVSVLLARSAERRMFCTGLAFILGGALGNVVDRLRFGHVVDFVDLHAGAWHWPAFNVADSAITIGACVLILEAFVHDTTRARAPS